MCPQRTSGANPRSPRARQLAAALLLIALAAHPAAAVIGLVEANGKAVTTFTRCRRSSRALTLPIRFLSESSWEASFGAVTPSGTYAAASTRRTTTIPFTLDDASRSALLAELQARVTATCGRSIALQSITVRTFRGRLNTRRGKFTVKLSVAVGGSAQRERGSFRFAGHGTLGPLPTTTTTTTPTTTTSTLPSCTDLSVEACPATSEGEAVNERTNDDPPSAVQVSIGSRFQGTTGNADADSADVDLFKFDAARGDHLKLTVTQRAGGTFQPGGVIRQSAVGYSRLIRSGSADPSIATREFYIPESGEYVIVITDLRNLDGATQFVGGSAFTYRAELSRVTRAATIVAPPIVDRPGSVPSTGEITLLGFTAPMGSTIAASTRATQLPAPSKVDTVLLLFDASTTPPTLVASNDDVDLQAGNSDSALGVGAPTTGPYLLVVDHYDVGGIAAADRTWDVSLAAEVTECLPGATRACYEGPEGTSGVSVCRAGVQTCSRVGAWAGPCTGQVLPQPEFCNSIDEDCDGIADNACLPVESEGVDERNNDTPGTAVPVSIDTPIEGTIGNVTDGDGIDVDVFKFDAVRGDRLRVTITNRAGGSFQAYGSIGTDGFPFAIARPGTADPSTATREFYVRESGQHFLSIQDLRNVNGASPGEGGPTLTYSAQIVRVSAMPSIVTLPLVNQPGSVPGTGDVTAFLFTATEGNSLTASTRAKRLAPPSQVDTVLLLFDVFSVPPTLVASNDDIGNDQTDSAIATAAPRTGPYLLVVDHYDVGGIAAADRAWDVSLEKATPP